MKKIIFLLTLFFALPLVAASPRASLAVVASPTGATLTWTNPNTVPTTINAYRCAGVGCTNFALLASGIVAPYIDTTVVSGSYSYQVKAVAQDGVTLSPASNTAVYTLAPLAPTGLSAN